MFPPPKRKVFDITIKIEIQLLLYYTCLHNSTSNDSKTQQDLLPQIMMCQRQLYFPSDPELILIVHRQWSVVKVPAKTIALFIYAATAINYY